MLFTMPGKGLVEIDPNVFDVLQANTEAQQVHGHTGGLAVGGGHQSVSRRGRVLAGGEREHRGREPDRAGRVIARGPDPRPVRR